MRMANPIPQFSHLVRAIAKAHPNLAYLHVVEPRVSGVGDRKVAEGEVCTNEGKDMDIQLMILLPV